jgi:hypothetical protein
MKQKWFYWMIPLLFMAAPAGAGWDSDEDGTGNDCEVSRPNRANQRRCYWNYVAAEGTGYSNQLVIDSCENYSVAFTPDFDGTDTTGTIQVLICLDDANVPNSCHVLEGKTLSSAVPVIYGADGTWLYMDIIAACGAGANCRVEFRCNQ